MTLKIITAEEPIHVDQIITAIYGQPGIGKSTLGFSSESPLMLDFDKGAQRAKGRKDSVRIDSWGDVESMVEEDLQPFKTIIVDTAGRALDSMTMDIIKKNPKHGYSGNLTLQGYGVLKGRFSSWLKFLTSIGKDVVLIAHSTEEKKGDDILERLDVQGGSKNEIYKSADAMGRLSISNGKRILDFSPTDIAFGKNPACLPQLFVPEISADPIFLAKVIQNIKDKLNELTEEQEKRMSMVADWMSKFAEAKTADDFNALVEETKSADASVITIVKSALHKKATASGFKYQDGRGYA